MKKLVFQVEFLSDIVLPATSNNEGKIEQLDFIPGSNFLGMVASESYNEMSNSFDVFHSGKVRFGDATLLVEGKKTYKMPLSFFHEKLNDKEMVNHHLITDFKEFVQLKQKRKGFITENLDEISIKYNYAQKSAYDKKHRRSKDSSMYGYSSIPAKTQWQFVVNCDDSISVEDIEKIKSSLVGKKRLGKSKSAQYGEIQISLGSFSATLQTVEPKEEMVLYAKSRLALVDEEGNPTYDLRYLVEGLDDENIVWEKSQIRTSSFSPYNGAMQTKSYERVVILSGSVIVVKNLSPAQLQEIKNGVGVYLCEGFGEIVVNPIFALKEGKFSLTKQDNDLETQKEPISTSLGKFLKAKREAEELSLNLAERVSTFVNKKKKSLYNNISNAQWGTIRSICSAKRANFKNEIRNYISSGKITWTNEQIETLLEERKSREFILQVAMQMPKIKEEK